MKTDSNPFLDPAPEEIHLPDSPLVRVIAQVQFPTQLRLVELSTIAGLQSALSEEYPVLEEQHLRTFEFNFGMGDQEGKIQRAPSFEPQSQWRFSNPETGMVLQINSTSITFETHRYVSRQDFFERFLAILRQIQEHSPISLATRLGVRYVDRVPDSRHRHVESMLTNGFGGLSARALKVPVQVDLQEFQVELPTERGVCHGRIGFLPPGGTFEPLVLPALQERNWVLDIDVFRHSPLTPFRFDPGELANDASAFALRIYTVFRWIVSNEFLKTFGAQI